MPRRQHLAGRDRDGVGEVESLVRRQSAADEPPRACRRRRARRQRRPVHSLDGKGEGGSGARLGAGEAERKNTSLRAAILHRHPIVFDIVDGVEGIVIRNRIGAGGDPARAGPAGRGGAYPERGGGQQGAGEEPE